MSVGRGKAPGRLAAAERFFDLKLTEARVEQAAAERVLETEHGKRMEIEKELSGLDAYRRALMQEAGGTNAVLLDQAYRYRIWIAARLEEQHAAIEAAQGECEAKRANTRGRYEDIAVLKRAAERRRELLHTEQLRREERLLDAQAALKLCAEKKQRERD